MAGTDTSGLRDQLDQRLAGLPSRRICYSIAISTDPESDVRFRWLPVVIACLPMISCGQTLRPVAASQYSPPSDHAQDPSACSSDRAKSALSVRKMLSILMGVGSQTKDEFETTEQFQARVDAMVRATLARNNLSPDNVAITINVPSIDVEYEADLQVLKVGVKLSYLPAPFDNTHALLHTRYINLLSFSSMANYKNHIATDYIADNEEYSLGATGSYVGSNAFGLKKKVLETHASSIGLLVPNLGSSGWPQGDGDHRVTLPGITPDVARSAKDSFAVLFVGALQAPYVVTGESHISPTVRFPMEITTQQEVVRMTPRCAAMVNRKTGEVLRNL
jgi:hypothetical protein